MAFRTLLTSLCPPPLPSEPRVCEQTPRVLGEGPLFLIWCQVRPFLNKLFRLCFLVACGFCEFFLQTALFPQVESSLASATHMLLSPRRAWQSLAAQLFLGTGAVKRPILKLHTAFLNTGFDHQHFTCGLSPGTSLSWVGWGPCWVSCPYLLIFRGWMWPIRPAFHCSFSLLGLFPLLAPQSLSLT